MLCNVAENRLKLKKLFEKISNLYVLKAKAWKRMVYLHYN